MMRRHLTGNEASQAVGMLQAGQVERAVAGHFNVSQSVISRLWNRFQHTGNVAERPRSGRPRKTTVRQDRYIFSSIQHSFTHTYVARITKFPIFTYNVLNCI